MAWFIVLLLIFLSALFSSAETAFTALSPVLLQKQAEQDKKVGRILRVIREPRRFLATVLVGNNIVNIAAASLTTVLTIRMYGETGAVYATVGLTAALLLFAEILPKTIAAVIPLVVARLLLPIVQLVEILLWPVIALFSGLARVIFFFLRLPNQRPVWVPSIDEIQHLVDQSEEGGTLDRDRGDMIDALLELGNVPSRAVMIPRRKVQRLGIDWSADAVEQALTQSSFTRMPVFEGNDDNVTGLLLAKEFFRWRISHPEGGSWRSLIAPLSFYLDETAVLDLLRQMRYNREHLVGIVDEYGEFEGILTLEDVLEEILYPEESGRRVPIIRRLGGIVEIKGDTSLRDVARALDLEIEEDEEAETVGGWVANLGARYRGDCTVVPGGSWKVEVLDGDERGVGRVRLTPRSDEEDHEEL